MFLFKVMNNFNNINSFIYINNENIHQFIKSNLQYIRNDCCLTQGFVELTYIFEENSECKFKSEIFSASQPHPSPLQT